MMQFSLFENEVRPGVVMFIIRFFIFAAIASVILGHGNQIRPFFRMRTKIVTSVNELFCRMFATPGLASSSNGVNNAKPLFSERPINLKFLHVYYYLPYHYQYRISNQSINRNLAFWIRVKKSPLTPSVGDKIP